MRTDSEVIAKSTYPIVPHEDGVLIKVRYKLQTMMFATKHKEVKVDNMIHEIVGFGPKTHNLELGAIAIMNRDYNNIAPFAVDMPGNNKSYDSYVKLFNTLTAEERHLVNSRNNKFEVNTFIIVPSYGITGIIKPDNPEYDSYIDSVLNEIKVRPSVKQAKELFNV